MRIPRSIPPSESKSLERLWNNLFETLPRKNKNDLIDKVNTTLKRQRHREKQIYGDIADVDFRSSPLLFDQVKINRRQPIFR